MAFRGARGNRSRALGRGGSQKLPDPTGETLRIDAVEPVALSLPDLDGRRRDRPAEPVAVLRPGIVAEECQIRTADLREERLDQRRDAAIVLCEQRGPQRHHEVLPPPRDEDTLRTWAKQLGLKQGSEDWLKFFDYAAVDSGRIPDYVLKDEKLVAQLPVFFRTLSGQKPSREDLEKLIELIRSANRP